MNPPAGAVSAAEFACLMTPLGPFEPAPRLAVACSGGADSLALTMLAAQWARARGGDALALVVDHGLRPGSAAEAALTAHRLDGRGIPARLLTLRGLVRGPALAERARAARYAALETAAAGDGRVHLLLGHHARDQAETLAMRAQAGSGPAGRAAMPALAERSGVRLLRPLLAVPPVRLRATLRAAGLDWVEDPSNADPATLRARLRARLADPDGTGPATRAAVAATQASGAARAAEERRVAACVAARARLVPEGFAVLAPGPWLPAALAALLRAVAGAIFAPAPAQVAALAAAPRAVTLGGARLVPAGRRCPGGWLLVREAAAMSPPVPAFAGAVWDGRFRLAGAVPEGLSLGPLGAAASRFGRRAFWPAAALRTLPALWRGETLAAVPHLRYAESLEMTHPYVLFAPPAPVCGAPFQPVRSAGADGLRPGG